ncbi:Hypp4662 [Branchiostoma lanceolatum]|uniref:Hypp4662 protein n=1 Tax=Branchiostoma lanceolatum TaxID=7740 RepID=A0A8K0AAW9_BRALA|nr:Hypp4662 [Branchiostoma lanceolatum]
MTEVSYYVSDVSAYFYGVKEDVSADYKDLASFLGIHDTRNIESRNRDATSCCMDVLETWKRSKGDQATVEVLEQALFSAGLQSAAENLRRERERRERDRDSGERRELSSTDRESTQRKGVRNGWKRKL